MQLRRIHVSTALQNLPRETRKWPVGRRNASVVMDRASFTVVFSSFLAIPGLGEAARLRVLIAPGVLQKS